MSTQQISKHPSFFVIPTGGYFLPKGSQNGHAPSIYRDAHLVQLIIQPLCVHAHVCWSSVLVYLYNEEADLAVISIQYAYNAKLY